MKTFRPVFLCPHCGQLAELGFPVPLGGTRMDFVDNAMGCSRCGASVWLPDILTVPTEGSGVAVIIDKPDGMQTVALRFEEVISDLRAAGTPADIEKVREKHPWLGRVWEDLGDPATPDLINKWLDVAIKVVTLVKEIALTCAAVAVPVVITDGAVREAIKSVLEAEVDTEGHAMEHGGQDPGGEDRQPLPTERSAEAGGEDDQDAVYD